MKKQILPSSLIALLLLAGLSSFTSRPKFADDFLEFWTDVKDNYAYFDQKHTDWEKVKTVYLAKAKKAKKRSDLVTVFEEAVEELYDHHFSLNTNLQSSTRLVPTGIDMWAEYVDGRPVITEVRKGFSAEKAGINGGMEIKSINGIPVEQAVLNRVGKCIDPIDTGAKSYALRQLLAGTYTVPRVLVVQHNGIASTISVDANGNLTDQYQYPSLLDFSILDDNIGYIKINNSLGQTDVIALFDSALSGLKNTKALIIDLRETPSGGNSIVARGILGRFIKVEMPYQKHVLHNDENNFGIKRSWVEIVSPRGPFAYDKPVVILVNHWTGSMGEGIAIGFDALERATIVGTRMAGLNGAISGFQTSRIKIPYSFPTEQLYHINGTPREAYVPKHLVDMRDDKYYGIDDPVLAEGIKVIRNATY